MISFQYNLVIMVKEKKVAVKKTVAKVTKKSAASKKVTAKTVKKPDTIKEVATKKEKPAQSSKKTLTAQTGKQDLIVMFATKDGDTGSPEVQIALATHKILNLTQHLEGNPKDNHSRRGLLKVISKRRRILNYLREKDAQRYKGLMAKLNLPK